MGLFNKLKKKTEPEPIIDEKKLEQVARYQKKDHQVITDLQVKPLGKTNTYIEGKAFCKPWYTEIDVDMYGDVEIEEGTHLNAVIRGVTKKNRDELSAKLPLPCHAVIEERDNGVKTVIFELDEA